MKMSALVIVTLCAAPAWSAPVTLLHTLTEPVPVLSSEMGSAVAVDGNRVLLGRGTRVAGTVPMFSAVDGSLIRSFADPTPGTSTDGAHFGTSVAIKGSSVLIGDQLDNTLGTHVGQAHLFDADTGAVVHTFDNPLASFGSDSFGASVALNDTHALIGAPDSNFRRTGGNAHLFDVQTGLIERSFPNPVTTLGSWGFGQSLALDGNTAVIGSPVDETVYAFDILAGDLLWSVTDPGPPVFGGGFGFSVAASNGLVLVGDPADNTTGQLTGRAYLLDGATGSILHTLTSPTGYNAEVFGWSVALDGNVAMIGGWQYDTRGVPGPEGSGQVHFFDTSTGALIQSILDPTPGGADGFGYSVALQGGVAVAGAWRANAPGLSNSGEAHVFAVASTTTPVPVPAALPLLMAGVAALGGLRLRRKRA